MAEPAFEELFRNCGRSAVHLEMRDGYMRDDPLFIAWQAGQRHNPVDRESWWHPWLELMTQTTGRGVEVRRARIVSEPVSDYIRFEYDVTFTNIAVGEQVRWLPRRRATDLPLPGNDFWLFDGEVLAVNHFNGDGGWADVEPIEVTTDPSTVKLCAAAFEAVWERATPHQDYKPA